MVKSPRVSVVGATGLVGREILKLLELRKFPYSELTLYASSRSAGEEVYVNDKKYTVKELKKEDFIRDTDLALASAGKKVSALLREWVRGTNAVVVDNSSAFRMDPEVPLVVPECNPEDLAQHSGYIANPNCSTIQLVVALKALQDAFGLKRVVVSTYQAVSGAGHKAIEELSSQSIALFNQRDPEIKVFPHRIAFNLIPQIGAFDPSGYTEEELKVVYETRKILHIPDLPVTCTAVRVPVFACHSESVLVELEQDPDVADVRKAFEKQPGLVVLDDPSKNAYPMPLEGVEREEVFVGRLRKDLSGPRCFSFWCVSDNLWKGAALNALQVAEALLNPTWE
jgi:aspartate-semialdehyde dehydrogenase